jgi:hypothetical protein
LTEKKDICGMMDVCPARAKRIPQSQRVKAGLEVLRELRRK